MSLMQFMHGAGGSPLIYPRPVGVNAEHSAERYRLPDWVYAVICVAVLLGLGWVLQHGIPVLVDHLRSGQTTPAHVKTTDTTTTTNALSPSLRPTTPTTAQIVPVPANTNCPTCIPQPQFAPAP